MPSPSAAFVAPGVSPCGAGSSAWTAARVTRVRPAAPLVGRCRGPQRLSMVGKIDTETTSGESLMESDATEEVLARETPAAPATKVPAPPPSKSPPIPTIEPAIVPPPVDYVPPRRETFAGLVWDRLVDSATDARMHYGRLLLPNKQKNKTVTKPSVVVLGSGWGAHALIKVLDCDLYDVTVISPRNAFAFTPMLAAASVGTVEFRSLLEPVRVANELVDYVQASATEVDLERQTVTCVSDLGRVDDEAPVQFSVPYSYLVIAVGATTNTFGVPGVREHAFFLKSVVDARKIRAAIVNRFERANLPTTSDEEKLRLLHTVVIGGGPTGVEYVKAGGGRGGVWQAWAGGVGGSRLMSCLWHHGWEKRRVGGLGCRLMDACPAFVSCVMEWSAAHGGWWGGFVALALWRVSDSLFMAILWTFPPSRGFSSCVSCTDTALSSMISLRLTCAASTRGWSHS